MAAEPGKVGAVPEPKGSNQDTSLLPFPSSLTVSLIAGLVVGAVILIPFVVGIHPSWSALSAAAIFAAASAAAGGLLGLLFGVPRVATGQQTENTTVPGIIANTNLEQISDWLTKIIVGVSLTQFATIKRNGLHLFNAMAPALGGGATAASFAGAEVIYFSVLGFFNGWLYARLRLGALMSDADLLRNNVAALLNLSRRATKAGDPETASRAKQAAAVTVDALLKMSERASKAADPEIAARAKEAALAAVDTEPSPSQPVDPVELATNYDDLRNTEAASARRTALMEDLVRRARLLGRSNLFTGIDARNMFRTGDDGSRVVALGIMQGDPQKADPQSIIDAIQNARSGFEQYQALAVADLAAPTFDPTDQALLAQTLRSEAVQQQLGERTRRQFSEHILHTLDLG